MAEPLRFQTPARYWPPRTGRTPDLSINRVDLQEVRQNLVRWVTIPPVPLHQTPELDGDRQFPEHDGRQQSRPERRGLGYRLSELVGMVPLLAPLAAAGWYQADLAHEVFGWQYPLALIWPAAIEGGAAYAASLYLRKLVAGHSTISTRIGMLAYAAGSSALLWWHAIDGGKPWQAAAGIGGMTLAAVWIWTQRSRWLRRKDLQDRGLVDAQAPRYNLLRWLLCPIETPRAFRYSVKHAISDPGEGLAEYRRERTRRRTARALARARRRAERRRTRTQAQIPAPEVQAEPAAAEPVPEQTPVQAPASAAGQNGQTPPGSAGTGESRKPRRQNGQNSDAADLAAIREAYGEQNRPPSLKQIRDVVGCGVTKAQRLQGLVRTRIGVLS